MYGLFINIIRNMPFVKKNNSDFKIENNRIVLSKEYLEQNKFLFKKITGTRFASILKLNKYASPVKTWATIVNIYKESIDPTLAKVGNAIEPKIRDYVQSVLGCKYLCHNPFEVKWDAFKEDQYFGGIPDGEPVDSNGKIDYSKFPMLEVKTSSIDAFVYKKVNNVLQMQKDDNGYPLVKQTNQKKDSWFTNGEICIPDEYKYQLALYMYLRNITKGMFAVAFLTGEDYVHPENYKVNDRHVYLVEMNLTNRTKLEQQIEYARNWYKEFVEKGISPELSIDDRKWLNNELINEQ